MTPSDDPLSDLSRMIEESEQRLLNKTRHATSATPSAADDDFDVSFEIRLNEELQRLVRSGETITFHELAERFPRHAEQLKQAFAQAASGTSQSNAAGAASAPGDQPGTRAPATHGAQPAKTWGGGAVTGGQLPESFGRYRITDTIGSGGFGVVYRGWDEQLQRAVAIKVARRLSESVHSTTAYLDEARFLAQLDHSAIVPVFDVGQTEQGVLFVVSKFLEGTDLASHLRSQRVDVRQAVAIVRQIAAALDYAHGHGVVHRDVKPGNIILGQNGKPVLVDFGLAIRDADFGLGATFVGTPAYMSPEQARQEGHRVDGRSDIYSLGVVLYELLTGTRPFNASSVSALLELIRKVEVRPPRQIDRSIPRELERICLKALAKRVAERYSTAADLADDLQHWESTATAITEVVPPRPDSVLDSTPTSDSSRQQVVAIVPRGLRSFEAEDADYFLNLLPGARDRHGLPESVRFWKTRIEETDPDEAFRAAVLLGPSGSGKSSLVRAGLLPRLAPHVQTLIVDSRPHQLHERTLRRVMKLIPSLEGSRSLREALIAVRQNQGLPAGRKLLLVFDQFEQWLNFHDEETTDELVEALRQCDGIRVSALFLIRDDFTLAATQFMDLLEEPLSQTRNFATVDLFGKQHALRVLHAFGRSFGALADELPREQQRFLEEAIEGLSEDGQIVPIRIALFAEMVKDRPWTLATLRDYGGTQGIGVRFLEEKLNGQGAHPFLRSHRDLTRRLLESLMPDETELIKGPARRRQDLIERFAQQARPDTLDRILGLLDSELRLITPTGTVSDASTESESQVREPAYQLAHDYLVPTLRAWLTAADRSSRQGRARLRLKEQTEAWTVKPEPRRLPSLLEWLSIRLSVARSEWSGPQRRFMQAATRRLQLRSAVILVVLASSTGIAFELHGRSRSQALVNRALDATTSEIPEILPEMQGYQRWIGPLVSSELEQLQEQTADIPLEEIDDRTRRRNLHATLVLAMRQPTYDDALLAALPTLNPTELLVVRSLLKQRGFEHADKLWEQLEQQLERRSEAALATASLLAATHPEHSDWDRLSGPLADLLISTRAFHLADWIGHFAPVRSRLVPELLTRFQHSQPEDVTARSNMLDLLSAYSADAAEPLAAAIAGVSVNEFPVLFTPLRRLGSEATAALRTELQAQVVPPSSLGSTSPSAAEINSELEATIARFQGVLTDQGAIMLTVPVAELERLCEKMSALRYCPTSLRPGIESTQEAVAISWQRRDAAFRWQLDCSPAALQEHHREATREGLTLVDVSYWSSAEARPSEPRLAALWVEADHEQETQLLVDRPLFELGPEIRQRQESGQQLDRFDVRFAPDGSARGTILLQQPGVTPPNNIWRVRYDATFGDIYPGYVQTDCRCLVLNPAVANPLSFVNSYYKYAPYESVNYRSLAARSALRSGHAQRGLELYDELFAVLPDNTTLIADRGVAQWAAADDQALEATLERYRMLQGHPRREALLSLRLALLRGQTTDALTALERLRQVADQQSDDGRAQADHAIGLALSIGLTAPSVVPPIADSSTALENRQQQAVAQLLRAAKLLDTGDLAELVQRQEFDQLRTDPQFQQLLVDRGISVQFSGVWSEDSAWESRLLKNLPIEEHQVRARRLLQEGFHPISVSLAASGRSTCTTVWQRPRVDIPGRIERSRQVVNLAVALARMRETEFLLDILQDTYGRQARSHLAVHAHQLGLPPDVLARMFRRAESSALKRNVLLTLGGYPLEALSDDDQAYFRSRLPELINSQRDAGLRAAVVWCAHQWFANLETIANGLQRTDAREWSVTLAGHIMVPIRGPVDIPLGSPPNEPHRVTGEQLHWVRIDRSFSLSATETTVGQFQEFLDDARVRDYEARTNRVFSFSEQRAPNEACPQTSVRWYDAARYCQWLSEQEGLPESEWCYPGIWEMSEDEFQVPDDYLSRTGYRLPTEAEWETACRAGSAAAYSFGDDLELLDQFGWSSNISQGRTWPVARLRPNDLGFFDMYGNVAEWCFNENAPYALPDDSYITFDELTSTSVKPTSYRMLRGGPYSYAPPELRSARRLRAHPTSNSTTNGFRVARTLK